MSQSLKEELKMKKFRNHHQEVALNIIYTSGWIQSRHLAILKEFGISAQQYNVLRILRGSSPQPLSLGELKSRMLDRMSDTSRIVDRLATSGLVKRTTDRTDRRISAIAITEKGQRIISALDEKEIEIDEITGNLDKEEALLLSRLLDKIRS